MTANQRSLGLYLVRFKLTLCTNWSRVFSPEAGELQKVGLGCFCAIERPSPLVSSTLPPTETRDVRSIDRGGRESKSCAVVRCAFKTDPFSSREIGSTIIPPPLDVIPGGRVAGPWRGAGLMLSAAATPLAGRASHFAAQSQSHRQGREETSAERTVGPSGRSSRNAPRPDGRSDVVVCFYVFGLYHSFMMKKTIYRTCLFGRTGPRKMVHADSTLAPILPRHGDGRGSGRERGSGSNRDETRERPLPSFLLRCFDFALSGGRARAEVKTSVVCSSFGDSFVVHFDPTEVFNQ